MRRPWSGPSSPPPRPGAWTRTRSPTCSGCRPPPFATPTSPCGVGSSRRTPPPGPPPAGSRPSGHSTVTSRTPSTPCSPATPTRRTRWPSSASATGRCAAARSCSAAARPWPRRRRRSWGVEAVVSGAASEAAPLPPGPGRPGLGDDEQLARARPPRHGRRASPPSWPGPRPGPACSGPTTWPAGASSSPRPPTPAGSGGTLVRMWTGPRGAAADRPAADRPGARPGHVRGRRRADRRRRRSGRRGRVPGAVLLLARPTVLEASYSPLVSYARSGGVGRQWTEVLLRDGVATVPLRGPMPPAFRVRVDGYDGGPLGATPLGLPVPDPSAPAGRRPARGPRPVRRGLHRAAGSAVRSTVALEAPVAGDVLVPAAQGERPRPRAGRRSPTACCRAAPCCAPSGSSAAAAAAVGPVDVETTRAHRVDARPRCRSPPGSPGSAAT